MPSRYSLDPRSSSSWSSRAAQLEMQPQLLTVLHQPHCNVLQYTHAYIHISCIPGFLQVSVTESFFVTQFYSIFDLQLTTVALSVVHSASLSLVHSYDHIKEMCTIPIHLHVQFM